MNNTRKILAILLAAVLVLALSVSALAANTITVNSAVNGETYKAFKMLELSVNDANTPTAFRYTVNADWADFFAADNIAVWSTVFEKDAQGYITAKTGIADETAWSPTSALSKFAEDAAAFAKANNLTPVDTVTAANQTAVLTTQDPGYYLVTSTLGTRAMIDTTPGNVTINEKNAGDSIDKKVKEDSTGEYGASNDAQIGDTVEFKSVVTVVPRSINVKIHDTMERGLTLNPSSIKVYTDAELQHEYPAATVRPGNAADPGDTFTIDIPDSFAASAAAEQHLYVVYTAVLNENAINPTPGIDPQANTTNVSFGDGTSSTSVTTTTTTHRFDVFKHAKNSGDNLAGATFELKKNGAVLNLIKIDNHNYRVANAGETGTVTTFTTVADDRIVIWGVDADEDYALHETAAPAGYNALAGDVSVKVNADNSTVADVENQTGQELPSTGGIGTTIFYIVGGILVVGAAVVLISKKRMNAE